jgi:hypothetical protein
MTRPLRAMFAAIQDREAADDLLGGPCAGLRDIAKMLDRSAQFHWSGFQHALLHGERERADVLEQRARLYEELAELCRAHAWKPSALPTLTADERAELNLIFVDLVSASRAREKLAESARQARRADEPHGARYAEVALEREAAAVADAPVGVRNETLSHSAWSLARLACEGLIGPGAVLDALIPAAQAAGLSGREARATVRGALRRRCGRAT